MRAEIKRYKMLSDFERVSSLLRDNFVRYQKNGNITQPRWEYAHVHPAFNYQLAHRFGIWEEQGDIVAVAFYEMDVGECFMAAKLGVRKLDVWTFDYEAQVIQTLIKRGYEKKHAEPIRIYRYEKGFPAYTLPKGFSMVSLEDENDIQKIHGVLWRGFNHGDEPDDEVDCRLQMQSAPHFRKDLTIIIKAPNGEYACFCGMWLDGVNDYAYLEPLATDPRYRGRGLGMAALMEAMKRTQKFGATYSTGGEGAFYTRIGFETIHHYEKWSREWK
jgi:GNAT superfamily N-acetyltransferase